jgi:pyruvate,water dikinase
MAIIGAMQGEPSADPLSGTGVGSATCGGAARVVTTIDDALTRLEPGDVLVTGFTGPAWNSVLPMLGAIVVEEGGSRCHAAIVAREFALPAVVGAAGATPGDPRWRPGRGRPGGGNRHRALSLDSPMR